MTYKINELPVAERPRERLSEFGASSLSLNELLSLVIAQGSRKAQVSSISYELLARYGSTQNLSAATLKELRDIPGIGYAKAAQLIAVFELGKRFNSERSYSAGAKTIFTNEDAYLQVRPYLVGKKREHLLLFCLDAQRKLVCKPEIISIGILNSSLIHPREIFASAIKNNAVNIILAHNHPSGNSLPSDPDIQVTKQLFEASKIMNIQLLDHLILCDSEYSSIRQLYPEIFRQDL